MRSIICAKVLECNSVSGILRMCCVDAKEVLAFLEPFMKDMVEELNSVKREMSLLNKRMDDLTQRVNSGGEELVAELQVLRSSLQTTAPQLSAISGAVTQSITPLLARIEDQISELAVEDLGE